MTPARWRRRVPAAPCRTGPFVTINWFDDNEARDEFTDLGTTGGGIMYVVGDKWSIEVPGQEDVLDRLAEETGGEKVGG
jgi:hypothetical protein